MATAEFPVKGGVINGVPIGGAVPTPSPGSCTGALVPNVVGQTVVAARAAWTNAGFTGAFSPASGSDTNTVTAQTTNPASTVGACLAKTATITVTHQVSCFAPQLVGVKSSSAKAVYNGAGFGGTFTIKRPPNNDYTIGSQSLVGGQNYLCNAPMTVFK